MASCQKTQIYCAIPCLGAKAIIRMLDWRHNIAMGELLDGYGVRNCLGLSGSQV